MPDGLYEKDLLIWSEQQAALLERLAAGERVNEAVDWPNLIEEVRDLGLSELRACRSWTALICLHLLKIRTRPADREVGHWTTEVEAFLTQLQQHFVPSMRQKVDVTGHYQKARLSICRRDQELLDAIPETCPFTLEDLLTEEASVEDLLAKLHAGHE